VGDGGFHPVYSAAGEDSPTGRGTGCRTGCESLRNTPELEHAGTGVGRGRSGLLEFSALAEAQPLNLAMTLLRPMRKNAGEDAAERRLLRAIEVDRPQLMRKSLGGSVDRSDRTLLGVFPEPAL